MIRCGYGTCHELAVVLLGGDSYCYDHAPQQQLAPTVFPTAEQIQVAAREAARRDLAFVEEQHHREAFEARWWKNDDDARNALMVWGGNMFINTYNAEIRSKLPDSFTRLYLWRHNKPSTAEYRCGFCGERHQWGKWARVDHKLVVLCESNLNIFMRELAPMTPTEIATIATGETVDGGTGIYVRCSHSKQDSTHCYWFILKVLVPDAERNLLIQKDM